MVSAKKNEFRSNFFLHRMWKMSLALSLTTGITNKTGYALNLKELNIYWQCCWDTRSIQLSSLSVPSLPIHCYTSYKLLGLALYSWVKWVKKKILDNEMGLGHFLHWTTIKQPWFISKKAATAQESLKEAVSVITFLRNASWKVSVPCSRKNSELETWPKG